MQMYVNEKGKKLSKFHFEHEMRGVLNQVFVLPMKKYRIRGPCAKIPTSVNLIFET